ncbi:hypothetical protein MLD38_031094 [Melastoma candidum]|uniref:Uncharacterized protein n=1 Tax=Melastoma candidum TaxID=119954 RepID=A0ACB9MNA3_9MYRT|nr:hypothetical protein MLD38_031094 [Melastoma candidum]
MNERPLASLHPPRQWSLLFLSFIQPSQVISSAAISCGEYFVFCKCRYNSKVKVFSTMTSTSVSLCNACLAHSPKTQIIKQPNSFFGTRHDVMYNLWRGRKSSLSCQTVKVFRVLAVTKGSAESSKSEESIPSWARPDSDEPPPWARDDGKEGNLASQSFELPYVVYLLASAVTAIAAIGSVFEYVNQRPVFGVLGSDSVFYAPLLGFFAISGIPTSAFLWFKAVQVANKEAEEQDRRDGYM